MAEENCDSCSFLSRQHTLARESRNTKNPLRPLFQETGQSLQHPCTFSTKTWGLSGPANPAWGPKCLASYCRTKLWLVACALCVTT